jgi:hypothetical protein
MRVAASGGISASIVSSSTQVLSAPARSTSAGVQTWPWSTWVWATTFPPFVRLNRRFPGVIHDAPAASAASIVPLIDISTSQPRLGASPMPRRHRMGTDGWRHEA